MKIKGLMCMLRVRDKTYAFSFLVCNIIYSKTITLTRRVGGFFGILFFLGRGRVLRLWSQ